MNLRKLFQATVFVIVVVVIVNIVRTTAKTLESGDRLHTLENEIADLQQQNSKLRRVLADRNTHAFVESVARNKLNYMKEGESLFVVVGNETGPSIEEKLVNEFKQMTPLQQWRLYLFDGI